MNALKWAKAITHKRRCVTKVRKSSEKETRKRLQYHVHGQLMKEGQKIMNILRTTKSTLEQMKVKTTASTTPGL